jgi:hypothetical protein
MAEHKLSQKNLLLMGLALFLIVVVGSIFLYARLRQATPDFLSEIKLKDRCPLRQDQTYTVCVAEGDSFVPQRDIGRSLRRGDLVLVKSRVDAYLKNKPDTAHKVAPGLYQICAYTQLFPTKGKKLSEEYKKSLALSTFLMGKGYYVYCSKPTKLEGYEAKVAGVVTRTTNDAVVALGIWLFHGSNFSDHVGFSRAYNTRIPLYFVSRKVAE